MRKPPKKLRKGIVLITTLAIMTFLVMLGTMLITTGSNAMRRAASFVESERAYQAAISGVAYAQARIEADVGWMGTSTATRDAVEQSGYSISETNQAGNHSVIGTITGSDGSISQFRMYFTGVLGDSNTEPPISSDSSSAFSPTISYSSVNNLWNNQASTTGTRVWSPGDGKTFYYRDVSQQTLLLVVEGLTRDTQNNMKARRVVEVSMKRQLSRTGYGLDSVAFAGGDLKINLARDVGGKTPGNLTVSRSSGLEQPGIRPLGNVVLSGDSVSDFNNTAEATIYLTQGPGYDPNNSSTWVNTANTATLSNAIANGGTGTDDGKSLQPTPPSRGYDTKANSQKDFPQISIQEAYSGKKNNASSFGATYPGAATIPAGTYVYVENGNSGNYKLQYSADATLDPNKFYYITNQEIHEYSSKAAYDAAPNTFTNFTLSNPPAGSTGYFGDASHGNVNVTFSGPTQVVAQPRSDGTTQNSSLSIVAADTLRTTVRPNVVLTPPSSAGTSMGPVLYAAKGSDPNGLAGSIYLGANVEGHGGVVAEGTLTFQGKSIVSPALTSSTAGVTMYAGGDLNVQPISVTTVTASAQANSNWASNEIMYQVLNYTNGHAITDLKATLNDVMNAPARVPGTSNYYTDSKGNTLTVKDILTSPLSASPRIDSSGTITGLSKQDVSSAVTQVIKSNWQTTDAGLVPNVPLLSDPTSFTTYRAPSATYLSYQDQVFNGMLYTCGNFKADLGVTSGTARSFSVNGALVAYGAANPKSSLPGSDANKGNIDINAQQVIFNYDDDTLGAMAALMPFPFPVTKATFSTF